MKSSIHLVNCNFLISVLKLYVYKSLMIFTRGVTVFILKAFGMDLLVRDVLVPNECSIVFITACAKLAYGISF